ncbi:hypothetical protein BGX23_010016 [Mortierella sp. AD031]|nr:hypothetical protein BGX23_010016 [Mortierella sp. AD031]KAG0216826.1 hypothetical protein BGX33_012046 [Mortierella sp. NVP41]
MVHHTSVEDDYNNAAEAGTHVYISTFLKMTNPIRQTRVESTELDRQWQTISRARESVGLEGDNTYLDAAKIKEHGLKVGFSTRLDLATFCHVIFSPTLDLERVQRGVDDFVRLFLQGKEYKTKANQKPLQEIYSQLVAVILALYARHDRRTPKRISADTIRQACNSDVVPGLVSQSNFNPSPVINLAWRVANDPGQLNSLFNNTLKKIIDRVRLREKSLPRPVDKDAVNELQLEHDLIIASLHQAQPKEDFVDEYENQVWLSEEKPQTKVAVAVDVIEAVLAPSPSKKQPAAQQQQQQQQDVEMEEPPRKLPKATVAQKKQLQQKGSAGKERQASPSPPPSPQMDEMDVDDDIPQPPVRSLRSKRAETSGQAGSGPSVKQPVEKESRQDRASRRSARTEARRPRKSTSDSEGSSNENEDEDEEEEEEEPARKKRKTSKGKSRADRRRVTSSDSSEEGESSSEDRDNDVSDHTDPEPAKDKAGRRKTRRWTEKEVDRLMKLVPKFQYDESELKVKKRTVKWAALKAYDKSHGNVLRHRTQVMLKDKYREQTDSGQHRKQVHQLNLARAEKEKAEKEKAEKDKAEKTATAAVTPSSSKK